jgi:hypothetical protein
MSFWDEMKASFKGPAKLEPLAKPVILLQEDEEIVLHPQHEKLIYRIGELKRHIGTWKVEAQNEAGEWTWAVFGGVDAERRATEYQQSLNMRGEPTGSAEAPHGSGF